MLEKPMNLSILFPITVSYYTYHIQIVDLKKYPNVFLYLKELFGENIIVHPSWKTSGPTSTARLRPPNQDCKRPKT